MTVTHLPPRALAPSRLERGAVLIMTVGFMLLAVLCLALVVDTGRLFLEKRDLQRIADISAIEAASRKSCFLDVRNGIEKKWRQEDAQAAANRNGFDGTLAASCGTLVGGDVRGFSLNEADGTAVRVIVSRSVPASLIVGGLFTDAVDLTAVAVATKGGNPLAGLTIRSTTVNVNTDDSRLLNAVLGGLLGTSLNVSALGYNALIESKVNTLTLIDALATELNITAGGTEEVLSTQLTVGQLLTAVIGAVGSVGSDLFAGTIPNISNVLSALNIFALTTNSTLITLGDLLSVQTTTEQAAANIETSLFDLVQGSVQLASQGSVANINLPVNAFGLAQAGIRVKVIEPAQLSAIGDPTEINPLLGANDPNAIFVRTAQIRTLINLDLGGVVNVTSGLLGAVSGALSPLVNFLNTNISGLGLITGLGNLLSDVFSLLLTFCDNNCTPQNVLDARGGAIQIGLDVGGAKAYVSDYDCGSAKAIAAQASTEIGHLYIGKINEGDLFSAVKNPVVDVAPAPLLELGFKKVRPKRCFKILFLGQCEDLQWQQPNGSWLTETSSNNAKQTARLTVVAGLGVQSDLPIGNTSKLLSYVEPPDLGETPAYQGISGEDFVGSLSNTLSSLEVKAYSNFAGLLGGLLNTSFGLLNGLISALDPVLATLGSVLDPLANTLLNSLGANVAQADVGANLTCDSSEGVRLVN